MKVKKKKGFTLIEIVVALAAFMIIMLTITSILISVIKYSSMNNKDFNLGKVSQVVFETIKEKKVVVDNSENPNTKYTGGFNFCVNNESELKTYVRDNIFKNSGTFSNPESFTACNTDSSKKYCIGIKVSWQDNGSVTDPAGGKYHIGVYKVDVYCWDVEKGESSLIHRVTRISIE